MENCKECGKQTNALFRGMCQECHEKWLEDQEYEQWIDRTARPKKSKNMRGRKLPLLLCQHQNMLWIEEHPDATRLERIKALAYSLIGTADAPSESSLENFGLEEDFEITDEPLETCQAFDEIVMQCAGCEWWCDASLMNGEYCDECALDKDMDDE